MWHGKGTKAMRALLHSVSGPTTRHDTGPYPGPPSPQRIRTLWTPIPLLMITAHTG